MVPLYIRVPSYVVFSLLLQPFKAVEIVGRDDAWDRIRECAASGGEDGANSFIQLRSSKKQNDDTLSQNRVRIRHKHRDKGRFKQRTKGRFGRKRSGRGWGTPEGGDPEEEGLDLSKKELREALEKEMDEEDLPDIDPSKYSDIEQFDCQNHGKALQMSKDGDGFSFRELDTRNGTYDELFRINASLLPNAADMSGCAINPRDTIMYCTVFSWDGYISKMGSAAPNGDAGVYGAMYDQKPKSSPAYAQSGDDNKAACGMNPVAASSYCSMFNWKSFLLRLDFKKLEFLAKLPPIKFVAGAFSDVGTYFASTNDAKFLALPNIYKIKGYGFTSHPDLLDLEGEPLIRPKGFYAANDIVVVREDLEGNNKKDTFIMVLHGASLFIAKYEVHGHFSSHDPGNFTKTWVLPTGGGKEWAVYMNAWMFKGRVIFSSDDGGVFEVPLWHIDLSNKNGLADPEEGEEKLEKVDLHYVGESEVTEGSEGLNCLQSPDPWVTRIKPWDCKHVHQPIQVKKESDGIKVKKFHFESGLYTVLFTIPFTYTTPPFHTLNAVGIGPIDDIAYGCLQIFEHPAPFYLVRFDEKAIEYVAILQGPADPIAGTFDSDGSYFYIAGTVLKRIPRPHLLTGYDSEFAPELDDESHKRFISLAGASYFADIVAIVGDLAGEGEPNEYVLGLNNKRQFAVIEFREGSNRRWLLETNDIVGNDPENFGAAWNYNGKIFFASNSGKGVFEVDVEDLDLSKHSTVNVSRVGPAAKINDNDGMNCLKDEHSFKHHMKKHLRKKRREAKKQLLLAQQATLDMLP